MKKKIQLLFIGAIILAGCHKEEFKNLPNQGNSNENSKEETLRTIKKLQIGEYPIKTNYVLNETLSLDGLVVNITYSDGSVVSLTNETLPKEWLKGFSSEKPSKEKEIVIQPVGEGDVVRVSFNVDILPLVVQNAEIVKLVESDFKRITIPEGIKSIKNEAFGGNKTLEEITLPSTLEKLGTYTFYASNLKKVDFRNTLLDELPSGTFESCQFLTDVILPKTLRKIGGNAFYGTARLNNIEIPEGVEEIGNTAFSTSALTSVKLPNSIRTIRRSFYKCTSLTKVTTYGADYVGNDPERSILGESFQFCPNLEVMQIPGGVRQIGTSVLGECKVKELTIPANVERIEFNAFGNASSLQDIKLLGNEKKKIEENAFPSKFMEELLKKNELLGKIDKKELRKG